MSTKHTPGPWRVEYGNNHASVVAKVEHEVAHVPTLRSTNAEEDGNRDVMIANARLIAAAPELLEALKTLLAYATKADSAGVKKARAAIAKAEGSR